MWSRWKSRLVAVEDQRPDECSVFEDLVRRGERGEVVGGFVNGGGREAAAAARARRNYRMVTRG